VGLSRRRRQGFWTGGLLILSNSTSLTIQSLRCILEITARVLRHNNHRPRPTAAAFPTNTNKKDATVIIRLLLLLRSISNRRHRSSSSSKKCLRMAGATNNSILTLILNRAILLPVPQMVQQGAFNPASLMDRHTLPISSSSSSSSSQAVGPAASRTTDGAVYRHRQPRPMTWQQRASPAWSHWSTRSPRWKMTAVCFRGPEPVVIQTLPDRWGLTVRRVGWASLLSVAAPPRPVDFTPRHSLASRRVQRRRRRQRQQRQLTHLLAVVLQTTLFLVPRTHFRQVRSSSSSHLRQQLWGQTVQALAEILTNSSSSNSKLQVPRRTFPLAL